jgi:hypothetical protein
MIMRLAIIIGTFALGLLFGAAFNELLWTVQ